MSSVRRRADQHMSEEEFEELILGTLPPAVQTDLETHIVDCAECAHEYGNPQELLAALPFGARNPDDLFRADVVWQRIEDRLLVDTRRLPLVSEHLADGPGVLPSDVSDNMVPFERNDRGWGWKALAAVAVISLLIGGTIGQVLPRFGDEPDRETFTVEFAEDQGEATATLSYLPNEEIFLFSVSGLPAPPDGYVYQAWLINENGPIPTGTMGAGQEEMAAHGDRSQFTTFTITLEKGPLGAPQPTSKPVILADLTRQ